MGILEANNRLQQVLRVVDESDPHRRTKPDGVEGAEVWMKIGPAPAGPSEMQLAGMLTNHRFAQAFADGDAGKTAHYKMRWYNRRGERGPWSETLSATIAA